MTNGNDEKVRQLTEDLAPDAADLLYLVKAGGGDRKVQVGNLPASGTSLWEAVAVPTDEASWDTDNAVGTWVFNMDGSISQTDNTVGNATIASLANFPAVDMALEVEGQVDTLDGDGLAGWGFFAGCDPDGFGGLPDFADSVDERSRWGLGLPGASDPSGADITFAVLTAPFSSSIGAFTPYTVGEFRKLRFVPPVALYEADAVTAIMSTVVSAADAYAGATVANVPQFKLALAAEGAVTFRNFKAWRIPMPTLS